MRSNQVQIIAIGGGEEASRRCLPPDPKAQAVFDGEAPHGIDDGVFSRGLVGDANA